MIDFLSATKITNSKSALSEPNEFDPQLADLLDEYVTALEEGATPDVEQLAAEHPHLASEFRSFAKSLDLLHRATERATESVTARAHQNKNQIPQESIHTVNEIVEHEGKRILGDFEIGPEIGRGGMGIVYEARQISLDRPVALKVLPFAAVLDQKQIARFRNEAQAAAQLHHPNIVPVFAVGQHRGVHFYAMQYIEGQSLEAVVRELGLATRVTRLSESSDYQTAKRLGESCHTKNQSQIPLPGLPRRPFISEIQGGRGFPSSGIGSKNQSHFHRVAQLGAQAAEALHHAHEYGIIHRDIKPSNLLVDHSGKLWVTDFGLARMQNNPGVTLTGDIVGTLRYMSPEQAAGRQAQIDARTDIYALGATLYELLTHQQAFPGNNRQEISRRIEQQEPTQPRKINPAIPVDLETIVLQSMAKLPEARYATAQDLADDLNRYLAGKPTRARRPNVIDLAAKWIRRHRRIATLAAMFLVVLTIGSTVGALLLSRAQQRTESALLVAEENLQQARQVVDRFGSHFSNELSKLPGSGPLRQALLRDTLIHYRQFIAQAQGDPTLQAELATTHLKAASIASRLGHRNEAQNSYRQAIGLFETLEKSPDEITDGDRIIYRRLRATCLNNLGLLLASHGESDAAHDVYHQAIRLQTSLADLPGGEHKDVHTLAEMLTNRGLLARQIGDHADARKSLTKAIELLHGLMQEHPERSQHAHKMAIALNNRSFIDRDTSWPTAEKSCRQAIAILERLVKHGGNDLTESLNYRSDLASSYNNLGAILSHRDKLPAACDAYSLAIKSQQQLRRQAPEVIQTRSDLAISWNNLGQARSKLGDVSHADAAFEQSQNLLAELVSDFPGEIRFRSSLAGVLNNQAMALEQVGEIPQALAKYRSAIEHQSIAMQHAPQAIGYREYLSKHLFNYSRALRASGAPAEAAEAALKRRELWPQHGEHLFRIAIELTESAEQIVDTPLSDQYADAAIQTLRQAQSAGYQLPDGLSAKKAFDFLSDRPAFVALFMGDLRS